VKNMKRNIFALVAGLLIGVLIMFAFQMITPFLEIHYLKVSGITEPTDYLDALKGSFLLNAFYVFSWVTTVFLTAYCSAKLSKENLRSNSIICGGIFYLIFLVNPEMIETNILLYVSYVILGAIGLLLPAVLLKGARARVPRP